jgi:hypothetical protein
VTADPKPVPAAAQHRKLMMGQQCDSAVSMTLTLKPPVRVCGPLWRRAPRDSVARPQTVLQFSCVSGR